MHDHSKITRLITFHYKFTAMHMQLHTNFYYIAINQNIKTHKLLGYYSF